MTTKIIAAALSVLAATSLIAADAAPKREYPKTTKELAALPRLPTTKTPVPEDAGIYIGSGVYPNHGKMLTGGFCFTYWEPGTLDPTGAVELCVKEQVGNTLQFWRGNEILRDLCRLAKEKGLYSTCIYSRGERGIPHVITNELGATWLGYDFGEKFSFALNDWGDRGQTLETIAADYMKRVRAHVDKLHDMGWGNVMATSANFGLDIEVAAGVEIPCTEDFPFGSLTLSSSLGRGLYRQYNLPMWGAHLAHEWYSWIPHKNPYKMKTLETAFYLKYMTGAKIIINESGNWQLQSSLCEDSPMSKMPKPLRKLNVPVTDEMRKKYVEPIMPEARKKFPMLDYRSPVATKYRKIISDFYKFCLENPAPAGQPEATWAIAKGNLDLGGAGYAPASVICGAVELAKKNPNWMAGTPEMSWGTVLNSVMPKPPMLAPNKNIHFSATPYGQCDIVSFAADNVTADHLINNYKVVMFGGWNTCSEKQYKVLCEYVNRGGILVIGLCHLSTDNKREYLDMKPEKLVNGGDLSELCGLKVVGMTSRKWWATGPSERPNDLGFVARRRFGKMMVSLGQVEFTQDPSCYEDLAVDDEDAEPFIIRCRKGKGQVFLMNWWNYPAACNSDIGCGAEIADIGMVGYLYKYAAKLGRGNVYITGDDFENPDEDCNWIVYSYFPDAGKICMLNLDYKNERKCVLQQFGDKDFITLKPGEFRLIDSVKLRPEEKLNVE